MVSKRARAYLLVAGFFALGVVGGAAAGRAFTQRELAAALFAGDHQVREEMFLDAIARELDLSAEQRTRVAQVHQRHRSQRRELMRTVSETCGKPLEDLHAAMDAEMNGILDPEQAARWNRLMAQRRQRKSSEAVTTTSP